MAEIKSTLDLIMEKTKNLSLTDTEKKDIRRKELHGKVKGIMQRFLNGLADIRAIEDFMQNNQNDREIVLELLKQEALGHIEPNENNERIYQILRELMGQETNAISHLADTFMMDMRRQMAEHVKKSLLLLEVKGISGSAVMPNLQKDPTWQDWLENATAEFKKNTLKTMSKDLRQH